MSDEHGPFRADGVSTGRAINGQPHEPGPAPALARLQSIYGGPFKATGVTTGQGIDGRPLDGIEPDDEQDGSAGALPE